MTKQEIFNRALIIASRAHNGQVDKLGVDYILHPLAVSGMVHSVDEKIIAILHDVIEDTSWSPDEIKRLIGPKLFYALQSVTRSKCEPYDDFIARCKKNKLATSVKLADLRHNLLLSRRTPNDEQRRRKYLKAIKSLTTKEAK